MWFCFNDGFVSVVQDKLGIDELVVRARRPEILDELFPGREITILNHSDYKYRLYCSKQELASVVQNRIFDINYTNFKDSVDDSDLQDLYSNFWVGHYRYQK